jgi:Flp pilus assembly protein TadD
MVGTSSLRESQAQAQIGRLSTAASKATAAEQVQPFSSSPHLQLALILERAGSLDAAAREARKATSAEPTNWRTWLTLSRMEAQNGNARGAVAAYRKARSLNPLSPIFTSTRAGHSA